ANATLSWRVWARRKRSPRAPPRAADPVLRVRCRLENDPHPGVIEEQGVAPQELAPQIAVEELAARHHAGAVAEDRDERVGQRDTADLDSGQLYEAPRRRAPDAAAP